VGSQLHVLQLIIEGISCNKSYLSRIALDNDISVILLQETHAGDIEQLNNRGTVQGYNLASASYHKKYGTAVYMCQDIQTWEEITIQEYNNNTSFIQVKINDLNIINVYKPPNTGWKNSVLQFLKHPTLIAGDFNSHQQVWKYDNNDKNGEILNEWAERENLSLIFDAKDLGTFRSGRLQKDYNPDLCFTTRNGNVQTPPIRRIVLNDFPRSQHRPIIISIGIQIPVVNSVQKPR
jgi:exonuclease III